MIQFKTIAAITILPIKYANILQTCINCYVIKQPTLDRKYREKEGELVDSKEYVHSQRIAEYKNKL